MLIVVSNMKSSNALVSTAMLTAIFEESKQDNISLLSPFILKIIHDNNSVNDDEIIREMKEDYSFNNFPRAILKILLNRLKKTGIIKLEDKKYLINKNIDKVVKEFDDRLEKARKETDEIIHSLEKYFKDNTSFKMSYLDCRNSFAKFLDKNGYLLYEDINCAARLNKNKDKINYHIGNFINFHKENNDSIFRYLVNVIEGSLLANALYVNVENDNSSKLNNLTCFFDTSFMLRVLEFKDPIDNLSALELTNLLKEQGVKIKCFKHCYSEIENIIEDFIRNYGKVQEKTLENFIIKGLTVSEVRDILVNLDKLFEKLNIEIVDTPSYDNYKELKISEKQLTENLKQVYTDENISIRAIENDVASISAIIRLRHGKEYRKLEECPAIFVTTNWDVRNETNKLLNLDTTYKIAPAISDLDLTAIVWLKSLVNNKDLPEMKLTENAMAAVKSTEGIRRRFNQIKDNINSRKTDVNASTLHNLLCSNYFVEKLMINVDGDVNKIDTGILIRTYENTIKEKDILVENSNKMKADNEELVRKLFEKEEEERTQKERIYKKYSNYEEKICNGIKIVERLIPFLISVVLAYFSILDLLSEKKNYILYAISIYMIITSIFPVNVFSIFKVLFDKLNDVFFPIINYKLTNKAEKEISYIFSKK